MMVNIEKYGTTSGTRPLPVEWEPRLKKGDNIILSAFGAASPGAVYLKWAYGG